MDQSVYDRDYYERGIETGKSCYQNYRWISELTIPLAMTIIDYLNIKRGSKVLDYGCSKGFLVKAFRLLYRNAFGVDISRYAIEHLDPDVREYCYLKEGDSTYSGLCRYVRSIGGIIEFDYCVAKDVFEHISEKELSKELQFIGAKTMFAIIPLGDREGFVAVPNNMDYTHVTCKPKNWWIECFENNGWRLQEFMYQIEGIKDSYYEKYPEGFGFFTLINQK